MNWIDYFSPLEQAFDAGRCLGHLRAIWENDRLFSFDAFARTAKTCAARMEAAGLAGVERLPLAADGRTAYGDWVIPRAWDVVDAALSTLDGQVLASYRQTPCSLVMYSAPTPPGGIEAPLVRVDDPEKADLAALSGCLLLTGRPAGELVSLAVRAGARGILTDFFPLYPGVRESLEEMRGISRWDNDFIVPVNETGLFAFSLPPETGVALRGMLEKGPVRLRAEVNARFYDGCCETVSGCIPGSEPELPELFAYGHLYEPGADDNASGCAVLLELAAAINRLIAGGVLPRPRRTIRFAMGWECAGSMGYLHLHPERQGRMLCAIVADMVGTEAVDRTHLCLWHNTLSGYSFADLLLPAVDRDYRIWKGEDHPSEEKPFTFGSDNILGDPIWGMPTVAMITEPAFSYHSSLDTPERIDSAILKRDGLILGAFLLYLANAGEEAPPVLLREMERTPVPPAAKAPLLRSLNRLPARPDPALETAAAQAEFPIPSMPAEIGRAGGRDVPRRLVKGCLTFGPQPALRRFWQPAWNDRLNLPLFWADGRRSLWEIAVLSAAEQRKESPEAYAVQFALLREYFDFLAEHGYLEWRPANSEKEVSAGV